MPKEVKEEWSYPKCRFFFFKKTRLPPFGVHKKSMSVLRVGILVLLLVASVWAVDTEVDTDNVLEADSEVDKHAEIDAVHELKSTGWGHFWVG